MNITTLPGSERWPDRWGVMSDSGDKQYIVARDRNAIWGCNCPQGKFRRAEGDCKHIQEVKSKIGASTSPSPRKTRQWEIPSSKGDTTYTVTQYSDGHFECDCKGWIFTRVQCRHIQQVNRGETSGSFAKGTVGGNTVIVAPPRRSWTKEEIQDAAERQRTIRAERKTAERTTRTRNEPEHNEPAPKKTIKRSFDFDD